MQNRATVPGYPNYFATDDGFVYGLIGWDGANYYEYDVPKKLASSPDRKGYLQIHLRRSGQSKTVKAHRIILEAFVGPCPAGMECSHKDGNPANNRLDNLEWATGKANNELKAQHGTLLRGEKAARAKLTNLQVKEIIEMRGAGRSVKAISAEFGVSTPQVYRISNGKSWAHFSAI